MAFEISGSTQDPNYVLVRNTANGDVHEVSVAQAQQMGARESLVPATPRAPQPAAPMPQVPMGPPAPPAAQPRFAVAAKPRGVQPYNPQDDIETVTTGARRAGWQDNTQSRTGPDQSKLDALEADQTSLYERQIAAERKRAELEYSIADRDTQAAREEGLQKRLRADALAVPLRERETEIANARKALDDRDRRLRETQIDPDEVWKQKGAGTALLAAVSMGLEKFGMGLAGQSGPLASQQMIDRMIDRNVEAQIKNRNDARGELDRDTDLFRADVAPSAEGVKLERQALLQESTAAFLRAKAAEDGMARMAPALEQNAMAYEQKALESREKLMQLVETTATKKYDPGSPGTVTQRIRPEVTLRNQAQKEHRAATGEGGENGTAAVMAQGANLGMVPRRAAEPLNAAIVESEDIDALGRDVINKLKSGTSVKPGDDAKLTAAQTDLQLAIKAGTSGLSSEEDMKLITDTFGGKGRNFNTTQQIQAVEQFLSRRKAKLDRRLGQWDLPGVQFAKPLPDTINEPE